MFSRMGVTSAFPVPEQCSEAKGGEGEAGEGATLPWPKGEGPTQGMAFTVVATGWGEEPRLIPLLPNNSSSFLLV